MNLHEYQSKQLIAEYGLPIPLGYVCETPDQAVEAATKLGGKQWVIKCQVHAGGRGNAGGVKRVDSKDEVRQFAEHWLGQRLVTYQTDALGQPVTKVLVEQCTNVMQELYLGAVVDRASRRIVVMASLDGGVDIEKTARTNPERIYHVALDPLVGPQPYQGRQLAFQLGLKDKQVNQFTEIFIKLGRLFTERDVELIEINPLVITHELDLLCLDAKLSIDGNALFRQPAMRELHDPHQDDPREAHAAKWGLNYVALNGSIGCMVNGAGLAMATMDLVELYGGKPANFLDVGGTATKVRVCEAFKIILSDKKVKAVLVNIFGGIVRCDVIADGIIGAIEEVGVTVPVVVRLEGNSAQLGAERLAQSGLNIIAATSLTEAAQKVVAAAGGK